MKKLLYLIAIIFLFTRCEEEVKPNLETEEPRLVIESVFTDNGEPQSVFISETNSYFTGEDRKGVSGAEVVISDSEGFSETLTEDPDQIGKYITSSIIGKTGVDYTLSVRAKGYEYEATGTMQSPPILDSLTWRFVEETPLKDEGYYLYFYGKTPKPEISYYRWQVYLEGELHNTAPEDFLLASDEFVNEQLNDIEFPFAFFAGDNVRLEMYSLDREMFTYYNELLTILFNDGGLFSPPPVNPTSNIRNLTDPAIPPLGYFQVSAMVYEDVVITEK